MLTFAVVGLMSAIIALFVSFTDGFEYKNFKIDFREVDSTLVGIIFGGTVTAYVMRRNKKDQLENEYGSEEDVEGEK